MSENKEAMIVAPKIRHATIENSTVKTKEAVMFFKSTMEALHRKLSIPCNDAVWEQRSHDTKGNPDKIEVKSHDRKLRDKLYLCL